MRRYLNAAFWVRAQLPALGRVPVNVLGVLGFSAAGFAEPALWPIGLGLELTYLFAMAFNSRFRELVDAIERRASGGDAEQKRRALVRDLPRELQMRLVELERTCDKIHEIQTRTGDLLSDLNRDALRRLAWTYLKLLVARNTLALAGARESEADLSRKVAELDAAADEEGGEAARQSKSATLAILRERLANLQRRRRMLDEIDSDLTRIEAQADLMLENAGIQGAPPGIPVRMGLASDLLAPALFGDAGPAVAEIDRALSAGEGA